MTHAAIKGWAKCLPPAILSNPDLATFLDTDDDWIRSRTGIERRHIAADDQTTSDLAEGAAREAMAAAGVGPEDIDFIVVGTTC